MIKTGEVEVKRITKTEIESVMEIIYAAQKYFRDNGIDQWQDGYPNEETILNDFENNEVIGAYCDGKLIGCLLYTSTSAVRQYV